MVNSTGDAAATDAEEGCDTGAAVNGQPECTLRAAIEAANAAGGGEISFDIPGAGTPTIAAASVLPALTHSTNIDGTSQAAGAVQLMATGENALELASGTSMVKGLSIRGASVSAVLASGGTGHRILECYLGADATGTSADSTMTFGADAKAPDVSVEDSVIGTALGVYGEVGSDGLQVTGSKIGVAGNGEAPLGAPRVRSPSWRREPRCRRT